MADNRITVEFKVKKQISVALSMSDWIDIRIALGEAKNQAQKSHEAWKQLATELMEDGSSRFPHASSYAQYYRQEIENKERIINEITYQLTPDVKAARETVI